MNNLQMPEKSKEISCRITRTVLMYVQENNRGDLGPLLEGLPLDEAYLLDGNNWVSHAFIQQLYERMISVVNDDNAVFKMALSAERFGSLDILDRIVRLIGSPRLIYSQAVKYNRYLKRNGKVVIHEIGNGWAVIEDRYHDGSVKTRYDCDYTRGVLQGIPTLFGLPPATIEEVQCQVHREKYPRRIWPDKPPQGCGGCLYRVRWEPNSSIWRRILGGQSVKNQAIRTLQNANQLIQSKYDESRRLAEELQAANEALRASKADLERQRHELTESGLKYRMLAENMSDIVWIMDLATLTFSYMSPSVEKLRGFTVEEAITQTLEQSLSPATFEMAQQVMAEELAIDGREGVDPKRSRRLEVEQSLKGGGYGWVETMASFIRDDQGNPIAILGVTRDISNRKKAEAAIAESERRYRDLFENGMDMICVHDLEGNLIESNIPFKDEYGWSDKDLESANIRDFIPERFKGKFDDYLTRVKANGSDEGLMAFLDKSGRKLIIEYKNRLIYDQSGNPVAVQGTARDVTERVKAEKALKESEEKYREIVQHAPAGIYEFDMVTFKFTSVNDVMCEYTGYTKEAFLDLNPYDLLCEDSKKILDQVLEEVHGGSKEPRSVEYRVKGKNGREFWVLANTRFFFEGGVPMRAMVVVHDVTQIRQAEEEKRQLEIKLQNVRKLESLGTLAGGVAHDLNNILSGIVSFPDLLLLDLPQDSPLRSPLQSIKLSGEKAAEIVQDLLTLARRGVSSKRVLSLNRMAQSFMDSLEYKKIVHSRSDIKVETSITNDILNIYGSEVHISKSLMNLTANAVDAMPSTGTISISTANCYIDRPYHGFEIIPEGEYAVFTVSDTGIGISPTDLERIFEPFYTKKVMGRSGSGLGMSVVWGTVKDHEGYIDIQTQEGLGATFSLYFPATREEQKVEEPVYIEDYLGKGETILIVDDVCDQRNLARQMMERLGYQTETAESGEAAIELARQNRYDLLILDMIMPNGIDGLATYQQILEIHPEQKAVIASGFTETDHVREALRLGAGKYLKKPYTLEAIGLAVRKELDRASASINSD